MCLHFKLRLLVAHSIVGEGGKEKGVIFFSDLKCFKSHSFDISQCRYFLFLLSAIQVFDLS